MKKLTFDKLLVATSQFDDFEISDFDLVRDWYESSSKEVVVSFDDQFSQLKMSESITFLEEVDVLLPIANAPNVSQVREDFRTISESLKADKGGTSISFSKVEIDRTILWETSISIDQLIKDSRFNLLEKLAQDESLKSKLNPKFIAKSINRENDYFIVEFTIDGNGKQSYNDARSIFKIFGFSGLGDDFLKVIERFKIHKIGFTLTFSDDNIYNLGLIIENPTRELVLFLGGFTKEFSHVKLAIVEAALGVKLPNRISYTMDSRWGMNCLYSINS